jgi:hypothetical protein
MVKPVTVGAQFASDKEAAASGAVTTEIAESVETAKTKGKKEETIRRALRMKTALFTAIPVSFPSSPADNCPIFDQQLPE